MSVDGEPSTTVMEALELLPSTQESMNGTSTSAEGEAGK